MTRPLPRRRRLSRLLALLAFLPGVALAQQSILQGGATTAGHIPLYIQSGTAQPIVIDSGPAGGNTTGQGVSELNVTTRGNACNTPQAPVVCAGGGTGQLGTTFQLQDAWSTNSGGYHAFSFSPNDGTGGLIAYNAFGSASALPLRFNVNGTYYSFPFVTGGIVGPPSTVVNDLACWNNLVGTLLKDCGTQLTIGGSSGQIEYNNSGALGGFTVSGDGTLNTSTGALTISRINGEGVSLGGILTTGGQVTFAGGFTTTFSVGANSSVSLPVSGTLATIAGSEALINKTYNGNTWTSGTGTLTIGNGKTLTSSNTLTFAGTDGSTLNVGTGGTLGSAAFTATSAYVPSGTQVSAALSGDQAMNNTSNYFTGPTVTTGSSGMWFVTGTVTLVDTGTAPAIMFCKLWDGTTLAAGPGSAVNTVASGANDPVTITLSGILTSPAAAPRISCRDTSATTGKILFNASGNATTGTGDSGIVAFRLQ